MQKHVKRTDVRTVFLLKHDPLGKLIKEIDAQDAIPILESGLSIGSAQLSMTNTEPFYNSHLLLKSQDRIDLQKRSFQKMFEVARCFQINVAVGSLNEVIEGIIDILNREAKVSAD